MKMVKDNWQTPRDLFNKLNNEFVFDLDVAATSENKLCTTYCIDGLTADWSELQSYFTYYPICWMNPPYSRGNIDKFVKKAYEESQKGCTVVGLLPLRSASWFHKYVMKAYEIRFLTRRVKFIDPETGKQTKGSPNFDSIIVVWKTGTVDAPKVSSYMW